ncbi:MAG TPA: hypothetical protein G4O10_02720 [Dehalococcoidia bacterium]|nr:hypothetical protein [Dehalococcoidia bacterium]
MLRIRNLSQEVADVLRKPVTGLVKEETREEATEEFVEGLMKERERRQRR